ncbi:MAG TPA: hypothetical protein VFC90_00255 [Planctomycetota bacterium]|nr:hypothetical protein [Planctomycetota bacterium]
MRCDELRTLVADGAPLDDAARGHLADCTACSGEFAELRALTSARPVAPEGLRDRVLAALPTRRASRWAEIYRAAAILVIGIGVGFVSGFKIKPDRVVFRDLPEKTIVVEKTVPVPDDYVSNVAIAADFIYGEKRKGEGHLVEVQYVPNSVRVQSIVVDPQMKAIEQYCPVARQLGSLAQKRPDVVVYKKKDY